MNLKKLTIAPMLALALFAVGCGEDEVTCESACEDRKACANASEDIKSADCAEVCGDATKSANEEIGCQDEYDAFISCETGLDDVCDDASCADELLKYQACFEAAICTENPDLC